MDFDDTPEEARFRAEARSWLEAHASRRADSGRPRVPVADDEAQAHHVQACRRWQRTLYAANWAGITWPKEFGGRGGTAMQQVIFSQEQAQFDVSTGALTVGLGMVGPTLMTWGRPDQRDRYLGPMLRGDEMWCQLFSEPSAGSDLPSLITRAERDGDEFVVDGQKVWTTMAQYSDWAILLARTERSVPGRRGLSYLVVDMTTPGIEVRPLRQITGVAHFNEVFLTDVRVPSANLVGAEGAGWNVARTTLAAERMVIGTGGGTSFADVAALCRALGGVGDPVRRQEVAETYIGFELLRYLGLRVQTALSQGRAPGAEASLLKLAFSRQSARLGDLGLALLGPSGIASDGLATAADFWRDRFLGQWSSRIGGGTDEIQRNQIGERVLGLPREPSVQIQYPT
ncbi:MAG TPA: acyl-CoA dehydrogenase family protein [Acidimicrobiales bacterium]|nr:acyl-CoA dehydrogenase family protein [Acidimicrobiales bacterium]